MRTIIVGGVAGGASAAARLRRNDEAMEIAIYERGEFVSFANCGLPYHLGGVIPARESLLVQTPAGLRARFNIEVRTRCEVIAIDRAAKKVRVRDLEKGEEFEDRYDALILSPGAAPALPPVPGIDLPAVRVLRTIPDMDRILADLKAGARDATVVGGGFIGVETAENLAERGLAVRLIEAAPQCLLFLDPDMAAWPHAELRGRGVELLLSARLTALHDAGRGRTRVVVEGRAPFETDLLVVAAGVLPETGLARAAGLELGETGGILVDERLRTSDPDIFAVGDAIEGVHLVTGRKARIPLAGPANRQARVAADVICSRDAVWNPMLSTGIVKVFDLACASTGASAAQLAAAGIPFRTVTVHAGSHAGYYPGAAPVHLKLLYHPEGGKVLGAQACGVDGIDKRIDVIAAAMKTGATVRDLADLELCYAPPYGSAKDPVNQAGFVACNDLDGLAPVVDLAGLPALLAQGALPLDVRQPEEVACGTLPGALAIPLPELRARLGELPRDRVILPFCKVGLRGYVAQRILLQRGFTAVNLTGGYDGWRIVNDPPPANRAVRKEGADDQQSGVAGGCCGTAAAAPARTHEVDARGIPCPGPLLKLREALDRAAPGDLIRIESSDHGFAADAAAFAASGGHELVSLDRGKTVRAAVRVGRGPAMRPSAAPGDALTMVVFSADLDRAMASFIIASGALAMGRTVSLFFTFWGLNLLRAENGPAVRKNPIERMFGWMMPRGPERTGLSKMHFLGAGTAMMRGIMRAHKVSPASELLAGLVKGGAKLTACTMTMDLMGIKKEELIPGVEFGGVAAYLADAGEAGHNLFI